MKLKTKLIIVVFLTGTLFFSGCIDPWNMPEEPVLLLTLRTSSGKSVTTVKIEDSNSTQTLVNPDGPLEVYIGDDGFYRSAYTYELTEDASYTKIIFTPDGGPALTETINITNAEPGQVYSVVLDYN